MHFSPLLKNAPAAAARVLKKDCPCVGEKTSPDHLLGHIRIYSLADYFCMADLKSFARQQIMIVLHVHWNDDKLPLRDALEEAFSTTPDRDRGLRDVLILLLKTHPSLWVDDGDVNTWLNDHELVLEEVDGA